MYEMTPGEWTLFQLLTMISLAVQAIYLLIRPHWKDAFWLVGAGFALMFFCLSTGELVEELNFDRTVLPLTICFNLVLWRYVRGWLYLPLFVLGNLGLVLHLHEMIVFTRLGRPLIQPILDFFYLRT